MCCGAGLLRLVARIIGVSEFAPVSLQKPLSYLVGE